MYRKGTAAIILNKNKEILLVNLKSFEERFFVIPGGDAGEGESLEDSIYRELKEELGIGKHLLEFVGKSDNPLIVDFKTIKLLRGGKEYIGSEKYFFGFNFLGEDSDIDISGNEVRKYIWSSIEDLNKYLLFDNQFIETLKKLNEIF